MTGEIEGQEGDIWRATVLIHKLEWRRPQRSRPEQGAFHTKM